MKKPTPSPKSKTVTSVFKNENRQKVLSFEEFDGSFANWILPSLFLSILLGAALRLSHLSTLSFWVDEYVHVIRSRDFLAGVSNLFTDDNNGILLTIIMMPFHMVLGINEFSSRLPSVLFGLGSIYLLFILARKWVGIYPAMLACFMHSFSVYEIFWSRMARNYAIFEFFYLLLLYSFTLLISSFEINHSKKVTYSIGLIVSFTLAALSHQLAIFFIFSILFYFGIIGVSHLFKSRKFYSFRSILGLISAAWIIILLSPLFNKPLGHVLNAFLPAKIVEWVLVDWTRLGVLTRTNPFEAWKIYYGVFSWDFGWLFPTAFLGLLMLSAKRSTYALLAWVFLVVPLVLMSFVFREPALPRYYIYVYPLHLMLSGYFMAQVVWFVFNKTKLAGMQNFISKLVKIVPFLVILVFIPFKDMYNLVAGAKTSGYIVNKFLSHWSFTNWKDPSNWVKQNIKQGDLVFSTVPYASDYYMGIKNSLLFRQKQYNTKSNQYEMMPAMKNRKSAATEQDFYETLQNNPKVWVLADYYLNSALTDFSARDLLYNNFHLRPEACADGSVQVFEFDFKNKGRPINQTIIVELGKNENLYASPRMEIMIPRNNISIDPKIFVRVKGVDHDKELSIIINGANTFYFPVNLTEDFEYLSVTVPRRLLKADSNEIQLVYSKNIRLHEKYKGFLITDLKVGE